MSRAKTYKNIHDRRVECHERYSFDIFSDAGTTRATEPTEHIPRGPSPTEIRKTKTIFNIRDSY